jgi:hypothetical protein
VRLSTLRAAFAAAALVAASPAAALDLTGTWHVLVHYKDKVAHNADAERWEDRVWVFERDGDRLRWVDYPLVVLSDETGRFERLGTNRASRKLVYWTPTPEQQAELARGPKVNSRGSKSKTLRKTEQGWASANAHQESAGFITYEETWTVTGPPERPVFTRTDSLGGAMAEEAEGRTLYETTQVDEGTDSFRGKYDRDGNRLGTFVMTRVGAVEQLTPASEERQAERLREYFGLDEIGRELGTEEE